MLTKSRGRGIVDTMKAIKNSQDVSLAGKRCLVTGATSGIGLAAACALAARGAAVTGLGRDKTRAARALERVRAAARSSGAPEPRYEILDLSSLSAVASWADNFVASGGGGSGRSTARGLDILVNCAGLYSDRRTCTEEGYESQFAVNHLAHFCLTLGLLPLLELSPDARVITVSSGSHYYGRIRWQELERSLRGEPARGIYIGIRAYEQSKLANVLFSDRLARLHGAGSNLTVFTADPGLVNTDMGAKQGFSLGSLFWNLRRRGGTSPEQPAGALAWLAGEASLKGKTGLYWRDRAELTPSLRAQNHADADRLWSLSEAMVARALGQKEGAHAR